MSEIFTPELIEMIVTSVAGGFTAYHGIKIGLFVLGKFMERRKAKQEEKQVEENTKQRRRLGNLLSIVRALASDLAPTAPAEVPGPRR